MRWYDLRGLRRLALARWSFTRKGWHPRHRRLARLRALYWVLVRGHDTEICARCGGRVHIVYIVPDEIWQAATGWVPYSSGESAPGTLCPYCLDDLAREAGLPYLRWTCSTDDSAFTAWVASHPNRH